ncbi:hypothetical protein D1007_39465 [Hordeum vulgare]|nr:hypothetical protein D1007_39465 [Hordeum vulgare]
MPATVAFHGVARCSCSRLQRERERERGETREEEKKGRKERGAGEGRDAGRPAGGAPRRPVGEVKLGLRQVRRELLLLLDAGLRAGGRVHGDTSCGGNLAAVWLVEKTRWVAAGQDR